MNFIVFGIFGGFSAIYIKTKLYPLYVVLTLLIWNITNAYLNGINITVSENVYEIVFLTVSLSLSVLIPYFIIYFGKFFFIKYKKKELN
tara:strand:- start:27 stop:293 length:267 start_codon:yes stop_codon:yes gene_type:complete